MSTCLEEVKQVGTMQDGGPKRLTWGGSQKGHVGDLLQLKF